ncbi:TIGR03089 family protein [Nostocoides sp. F2B08]|uniref:TIGR03089 family protein n=1 Tax=Nostocoides sp. F2B08 TaxID=2653936 RepID=UPI001262D949|nr:TIGR03089 family protein [Tetrasphaera sp. F2B08]KAB7746348.1 TIGR03089 family protein [Tetrasphaera sp. F2B08]
MTRPDALLAQLQRSDAARPRITCYDDTDGPTNGERIELSARVLSNWVAKAANALQEDYDIEPGSVVLLALPPHWRTAYWALAVWSVGGCVALDADQPADVCVSDDRAVLADFVDRSGAGAGAVLVTLAALARHADERVGDGVMDEAAQLSTYADQFDAWAEADDDDPALVLDGDPVGYAALSSWAGQSELRQTEGAPRVHLSTYDTALFLRVLVSAWEADGSLVLSRGEPDVETVAARLVSEGVTHTL